MHARVNVRVNVRMDGRMTLGTGRPVRPAKEEAGGRRAGGGDEGDYDDDDGERQAPGIRNAPLQLHPSARNCTHCSSRHFATQAELINHMVGWGGLSRDTLIHALVV